MPLHRTTSLTLSVAKWPLALAATAFLPALAVTVVHAFTRMATAHDQGLPAAAGFAAYALVWALLLRHTRITWLSTLEHELTHCVFAWATFNRVTALRATLSSGGHMRYQGTQNWLISVAPYFFPTATVALLLARPFVPPGREVWVMALVGASVAYHVFSTWAETHHAQTDLQEAGFLFCWLWLPGANLLAFTLVFAWGVSGAGAMADVFSEVWRSPLNPILARGWGLCARVEGMAFVCGR